MSAIGSGFEDERQRFRQKRLKDDIRITVDGGINFDDDTRPRVANTNRQVAIVVYFWWRQHKEKHYQIPADSLEVQYSRGLLGGGTYGEVFHALVGGDGRGTRSSPLSVCAYLCGLYGTDLSLSADFHNSPCGTDPRLEGNQGCGEARKRRSHRPR